MTQKEILEDFARVLIKRKRTITALIYLLRSSFICTALGIIICLPLRYFWPITYHYILFALLLIPLFSYIYAYLPLIKIEEILMETDKKLHLNEKLSAAYQYVDSLNPYRDLLVNEAKQSIGEIDGKMVFKAQYSRRDPFLPLLLAIFFFLWFTNFSFLEIKDETLSMGEFLIDASEKIDALASESEDKEIDELSEEYKKLGERIQDKFMNESTLEDEVKKLSDKMEKKADSLAKESLDKESQILDQNSEENQLFQLNRKKEMSRELQDILESLLNTFSHKPQFSEQIRGNNKRESSKPNENPNYKERRDTNSDSSQENSQNSQENNKTGEENLSRNEQNQLGEEKLKNEGYENKGEFLDDDQLMGDKNESSDSNGQLPGNSKSGEEKETLIDELDNYNSTDEDNKPLDSYENRNESGEFDEDNIEGELREGEQMKSFIRALPRMEDSQSVDRELMLFYRNQLESYIASQEVIKEYESVIRDYFLSIGVLDE